MTGARDSCVHCDLPLLRGQGRFCCSGCWIAHRLSGSSERPLDGLLGRIVFSAFLTMGIMVFSLALYGEGWRGGEWESEDAALALRGLYRLAAFAFSLPVIGLLGLPMLDGVVRLRRWFSAESLALSGVLAAFALSTWHTLLGDGRGEVYFETVGMVLVLFSLGRWLDSRGRARTAALLKSSIREALETKGGDPTRAGSGPEPQTGERVRVAPGEVVTFDGKVVAGSSQVDLSVLTGEELPRRVAPGDSILTGTVPLDGFLELEVVSTGAERWIEKVEASLEKALARRGPIARLNDAVARFLLPAVAIVAAATFVVTLRTGGVESALMNALSVVLISCPCALGVATPIAFWIALGEAWKRGVLVRGADVLERLAGARRILFDKTGTLTRGSLTLERIELLEEGASEEASLAVARALEGNGSHPIARAVVAACEGREGLPELQAEDVVLEAGHGLRGRVGGEEHELVRSDVADEEYTSVVLRRGTTDVARLYFSGTLRQEAEAVVGHLRERGYEMGILTGDAQGPAARIAEALELPVLSGQLPAGKLDHVVASGRGTVFVGDGWNDATALAAADVGVTIHGAAAGSIERGAVHLQRGDLQGLPDVLHIARRAVVAARWNLVWALVYNPLGIALAATGRLNPVLAAGMMISSSLLVLWGSSRLRARLERQFDGNQAFRGRTHSSAIMNISSQICWPSRTH